MEKSRRKIHRKSPVFIRRPICFFLTINSNLHDRVLITGIQKTYFFNKLARHAKLLMKSPISNFEYFATLDHHKIMLNCLSLTAKNGDANLKNLDLFSYLEI